MIDKRNKPDLSDTCGECREEYARHRAVDNRCPYRDPDDGRLSGWIHTHFQPMPDDKGRHHL